MPERPKLLHHMGLVSFRLFCKNLGNLQEFFGQMVYRPTWPKIARTPMEKSNVFWLIVAKYFYIWTQGKGDMADECIQMENLERECDDPEKISEYCCPVDVVHKKMGNILL